MDLFDQNRERHLREAAPLADRMRPNDIEAILGQSHLVAEGKVLRRAIEADRVPSMVLWGPPGSGKTTLARIVAKRTRSRFEQISAVTSGVADLRRLVGEAQERLAMYRRKTIVFVDEIHRFNKSQQDALLPHVEDGSITLIGATTENPYFSVNSALISRLRVFRLNPLTEQDIRSVILRALEDSEAGYAGEYDIEPQALDFIARISNGDSRTALNALELAAELAQAEGRSVIEIADVSEAVQQRPLAYDRDGDAHYDTVSAFIKSMRGSDPDASVYWLARMLHAGEDPRFIARRIVICAAEDVSNADPIALLVAQAAFSAVAQIGMPEAQIILAQACLYVATAPKSNSAVTAVKHAYKDVSEGASTVVPLHLRDSSYPNAKTLGHGRGYKYPHDFPNHHVRQQYLPDALKNTAYYNPSDQGMEATIKERLRALRLTDPDASDPKN